MGVRASFAGAVRRFCAGMAASLLVVFSVTAAAAQTPVKFTLDGRF